MKRSAKVVCGLMAVGVLALALTVAASATSQTSAVIPAFTASQLDALPGNDWITPAGNLGGQRHSTLDQINTSNVAQLKQAFHVNLTAPQVGDPVPEHGGEASHIEYQGVLYSEDMFGRVYANSATTGAKLWYYEPHNATTYTGKTAGPTEAGGQAGAPITSASAVAATRGVSIGEGLVYVAESPSATVVALDATTGQRVWAHVVANVNMGNTLSMAPVYYNGMILGATSGGDRGASDIAFALNAKTGAPLWHFNFVPTKKKSPGYSTWTHPLAFNGGGAVWASPSVDSQDGLVYFSTGNPIPYNPIVRGPGKEYYTDGVVALHVKSGKLAWFFQSVHHDQWDADQSQQPVLFDMTYNGQPRKAIEFANKDGLWYVLDRVTGKPIIPVKETPVPSTAADSKVASSYPTQPIPATDPLSPQTPPNPAQLKALTGPDNNPITVGSGPAAAFVSIVPTHYSVSSAFGTGANSAKPASIDQSAGLVFNESTPGFILLAAQSLPEVGTLLEGQNFFNEKIGSLAGTDAAAVSSSKLAAYDLKTGKLVWQVNRLNSSQTKGAASIAFTAGTMTTAGGLLFTSSSNQIDAFDEKTGQLLWTSPTLAGTITSLPMTYEVNGKQYVTAFVNSNGSNAIGSAHGEAGDLYTFTLP
jgi:alcohol dehydrogenase (cytochrome c)